MGFNSDFAEFLQTVTYETNATGSYVKGVFVPGAASQSSISAIIQPIPSEDLKMAPEGFRVDNSIQVKTESDLAIQGKIIIGSETFIIKMKRNWQSSIFDHFVYWCIKIEG
jgi:hypothetical protein